MAQLHQRLQPIETEKVMMMCVNESQQHLNTTCLNYLKKNAVAVCNLCFFSVEIQGDCCSI